MSILKRVLSEAIASTVRKSSDDKRKPGAETRDVGATIVETAQPKPSRAVDPGIKTVILNWNGGENDPFTVVNATIAQHLRACGKNVEVIEISASDWTPRLMELVSSGVEFAFTWQGLGSSAVVGEPRRSLWEHLKVPLICLHGDHPSHMPLNHRLEGRYCFHLYTNAEFARYSNRHFRRTRSAGVIDLPQLHREPRLGQRAGDHFIVAKNIDDPLGTERRWRQQLDKSVFEVYMLAAETLKSKLLRESYVEIHDVLDDLIAAHRPEWLSSADNLEGYHQYHSQLDHYMRSHKTISAVAGLREFPLRVHGRGWDRIAQDSPASHVFESGRKMANSQDLYYTRFGLVDVSPSKGLHDRTRRAMVNGGAFLSSANLEDSFADIERYAPLFFTFRTDELAEKCAAVVSDPEGHLAMAQQFAHTFHNRFHFRDFVNRLDQLAKLASLPQQ
jgi:hypothetical protein